MYTRYTSAEIAAEIIYPFDEEMKINAARQELVKAEREDILRFLRSLIAEDERPEEEPTTLLAQGLFEELAQ